MERSSPCPSHGRRAQAAAEPAERKPTGMSKEQKAKLRAEYIGLGGAENKAMPSNLFLNSA